MRILLALLILISFLPAMTRAASRPRDYLRQPPSWFAGPEARQIASNILSFQSPLGGWPKNTNTTAGPFTGDSKSLQPTFDNGATTDELRFLARVYTATSNETYRAAFHRGYDYILRAEYPTGGWPQFYPPPKNSYHRHITFNDDSMVRLMNFLRDTYSSSGYELLDPARKQAARQAFDRGITCILKCQVNVNGKLTAWCAQHDEINVRPTLGRSYELPSLSGAESVSIVRLLMSLPSPSPEVVRSIEAAVAWFQAAKIPGIRLVQQPDPKSPKGINKVVVQDPSAPPLWARFYDILTNRPIFVDRDGIPKYSIAEIGYERRNGYAWYGDWPQNLLQKEYPIWKARIATTPVLGAEKN